MTWLSSLGVAVLTGLLGLLVAGYLAARAVSWYRISSFEGQSGYFVVALALLGLVAGGLVGLLVARFGPGASFPRAAGLGTAVVLAIAAGAGGLARLLADVPPLQDGESLLLAVELRWPAGETPPADDPRVAAVTRLGAATSGGALRATREGPLFLDRAERRDVHWVVPGVTPIFTARGRRVLQILVDTSQLAGFILPLPGRPGTRERDWSEWLPSPKSGDPPLAEGFRVRYRVLKASEPIRVDRVGPFMIETRAGSFYRAGGRPGIASASTFRVLHGDRELPELAEAGAVAVLPGDRAALLVQTGETEGDQLCRLVVEGGSGVEVRTVGTCVAPIEARPLTDDEERWQAGRGEPLRGWVDRERFRTPGPYLLRDAVLDTRDLTFAALSQDETVGWINGLPPATLAPDGASFVRFVHDGGESRPALGVTPLSGGSSYLVPIDRDRMRYDDYQEIGPSWVRHHFEWVGQGAGPMRLVPRERFTPLPYRGRLEIARAGDYASYTLRPAGQALRAAIVDALVSTLGGTRLPDELDGYAQVVSIEGKKVKASIVSSGDFLSVSMDYGSTDLALMRRVAAALDSVVATGRLDPLFRSDRDPDR
ncbi:MAG: hypothetical protein R2909_14090 [Gemmatimonadales bacterium]